MKAELVVFDIGAKPKVRNTTQVGDDPGADRSDLMDLSAFAADPIAVGTIVGALALVMFAAAWHKLSEPDVFAGALRRYRPRCRHALVAGGRARAARRRGG